MYMRFCIQQLFRHLKKNKKDETNLYKLTKISVYAYAIAVTGRPKALVPAGMERSWLTLIPISNRARASHW
jgi:hypothetical protein